MYRTRRRLGRARRVGLLTVALTAVALAFPPATPGAWDPAAGAGDFEESIVVLRPGAELRPVLRRLGLLGTPVHTFSTIFTGFAAALGPADGARLAGDPAVAAVVPSRRHRVGQLEGFYRDVPVIDNAVRRIGALASPTAAIDGYDSPLDADIAVVDSGIPYGNPDLNVVGGVDCTGSGTWEDAVGHGTFVAGLAAARDNGLGVVGVAPGARLWAVKVMGADATVSDAAFLCGLEWVAQNAATIDVVNLSLGGPGNDADCGMWGYDALALQHAAVCRIVAGGVVAVAAAGNTPVDARLMNPAGFPEVITVSAFTDTDGQPGGWGSPPWCYAGSDDTLAAYSAFGPSVDITAPGTCVESTWLHGQYAVGSGTSAAAPLVSGAAALVRAAHPDWVVEQVRQFLLATATSGPIAGDYDGYPEPVLNVAGY